MPAKKNNRKKPKKNYTPPPSAGIFQPTEDVSQEQLDQVKQSLGMLKGRIDEYLKCYITIGYSLNGLPVIMIAGKTQQDLDSLNLALQRFITQNMGTIPGTNDSPHPHKS